MSSGSASATITANSLHVQQASNLATLNWSSFNISADGKVVFQQPNASSIALNRIFQGNPSNIFGSLTANGQIYLVNQNGFVFGSTSRVNTGGLLASALNITDSTFKSGLLTAITQQQPALSSDPVLGPDGKPLPIGITVETGAQLSTAAAGQRILLAAPTVSNAGSISAPDGQVILASGQKVYLYASTDPNLRGLLVEVDGGGKTINQIAGEISADRGNVTLMGLAVNQDGRVSATTSSSANGSIRLLARDSDPNQVVYTPGVAPRFLAQTGGDLELGPQSVTSALPDPADHSTAVDAQVQQPSTLELAGQSVILDGGSHIRAPDGQLSITARSDPTVAPNSNAPDPGARIRMDSGAVIDLSGSTATAPVTRNLVTAQLRGTELADDPLQRNGPLHGQTVIVDARADGGKGTSFADVSGEIDLIPRSIQERTDKGGSVTFDSTGDVGIASGAIVNVSGGAVDYTGGIMQTTQLVRADGTVVDISNANPNQVFVGLVNPIFKSVSSTWGVIDFIPSPGIAHYEPGYTQGASAGTIQVMAPSMVLEGNFLGQAQNGPYQRGGAGTAIGGQLIIGAPPTGTTASNAADLRAPAVELTASSPNIVFDNDAPLPNPSTLQLPLTFITSGGFAQVEITSNQRIIVPSGSAITLPAAGSLSLLAPRIDISAPITAPDGTIDVVSTPSIASIAAAPGVTAGIYVGNGVDLNVSGLWTNDMLVPLTTQPTGPVRPNAGSIALSQQVIGGSLDIGPDVTLSANAGAFLSRSGSLTPGSGGHLSLLSDVANGASTFQVGANLSVAAFGVQGSPGGSLQMEVPRLEIGSGDSTWLRPQTVSSDPASGSTLKVDASLFSDFGFSSFTLRADGEPISSGANTTVAALSMDPGSRIDLSTQTLLLNSGFASHPTGEDLLSFAQKTLLPDYQRTASQLSLLALPLQSSSTPGGLSIGTGATITADPNPTAGRQSSVTLQSTGSLQFDGVINIPAGSVAMSIIAPPEFNGFIPGLGLEIGPSARIDVAGTSVYQPNQSGLLEGTLLPGGSVSLLAQRGTVVTDLGSLIDFSGTRAEFDVRSTGPISTSTRETVASAGGSLSISASEAISLLGKLAGAAGTGTTGRAPGGSMSVALTAPVGVSGNPFPAAPLVIQLLRNGAQLSPEDSNRAILDPTRIAASGVDALSLLATNAIELGSGVNVNLARSIVLQSPAIIVDPGAPARVSAPYLELGSGTNISLGSAAAQPGNASVTFSGQRVDLTGNLAFQGVGAATIASSGTLQLLGSSAVGAATNSGSLTTAGDLTLGAAQVVPGTGVAFTINANLGAGNTVRFEQEGVSSGTPLSAAGSLTVNAADITQAGTILAPFGEITLNASQSLTLAAGSMTSVSGAGALVPYGLVQNGTAWLYGLTQDSATALTGVPARQITLNAPTTHIAQGSTINVSGGGDLYAWQWTPGTGGTTDALAGGQTPGLYAVIPGLGSKFAPYDPLMYEGSTLSPGQSIYLSGGGGLAAGVYTLLPARYGLLPGSFLIEAVSGYPNLQPGTQFRLPNGGTVVAGRTTFADTGLGATQYSAYAVLPGGPAAPAGSTAPGGYGHQLADYQDWLASNFFAPSSSSTSASTPTNTSPPVLPADAGTLVVSVTDALDALGTVLGKGASGGRNAQIFLSAPQIEIDPSVVASHQTGTVHLSTGVLDSWNAGSLVIGATQTAPDVLQPLADTVRVNTGAALAANEVLLVANQGITIAGGASVESTSATGASKPSPALSATPTSLTLSGDGAAGAAVVVLSDLDYFAPMRPAATGAPPATVTIASGAHVGSLGSITVDAPGGAQIADGTLSGPGARWALGADDVVIGPSGSTATGLTIDTSLMSALSRASAVQITGQTSIDVQQSFSLSSANATPIEQITLVTPALNNSGGATVATLSANTLALVGTASAQTLAPAAGTGRIAFAGQEIDLGPGSLTLSGFGETTLQAGEAIVGEGVATLSTSGDLAIASRLLTTAGGATVTVAAPSGQLSLVAPPAQSATSSGVTPGIGGSLSLTAQTLTDQTTILMPSGNVSLSAAAQLTLSSGAVIDVAGVTPAYAAGTHGSPGGSVLLQATGTASAPGNITMASGASISVAGAPGADAGRVDVAATGNANLAGQFSGASDANDLGGSFALQAGSLTGFGALNQALEQGAFDEQRDFRVGQGDLDLAAGSTITARHVTLSADTGSVQIDGTIDASASGERGSISLNGGQNVVVSGTGQLVANGADAMSRGGSIQLLARNGEIDLQSGSVLAASGVNGSGQLIIRAPEQAAANDISLSVATGLSKIDSVLVEPILVTPLGTATLAQTDVDAIMSNAAAFMAAATPVILGRLPQLTAANVALRPYVDLTYQGDLSVGPLELTGYRFAGQPADLAFRASGHLAINGVISDGFQTVNATQGSYLDLSCPASGGCPTANLTFVAGADFTAAAPASVMSGASADLSLAGASVIRTATGDITVAAARDVNIGDVTTGQTASIYSAGAPAVATTVNRAGQPTAYAFGDSTILVSAGRDVTGVPVTQAVTAWQPRTTPDSLNAIWGVNFSQFNWSVGALGGGDVVIQAGRNASNVSAATADVAVKDPAGALELSNAGNLTLRTGADVGSAYLYVADGLGRVQAGGAMTSARTDSSGDQLGSLLMSGDASFSLTARGDILLEGEYEPSLMGFPQSLGVPNKNQWFFRFMPDDDLRVASLGGSISLYTYPRFNGAFINGEVLAQLGALGMVVQPTVDLAAYKGNVHLSPGGALWAFPAPRGQVTLVAAQDIVGGNQARLGMSDVAPALLPTATTLSPSLFDGITATNLVLNSANSAIHAGDPSPALISAGRDIQNIGFYMAKPIAIEAVNDVSDVSLLGQNLSATDTTLISAGRDITYSSDPSAPDFDPTASVTVGGPGRLELLAGGNINLGFSAGVTTTGNLSNSNLPASTGSDVLMLAGLGAPLGVAPPSVTNPKDFVSEIIGASSTYQERLVTYTEQVTGEPQTSFAQAATTFRGLTVAQQLPLLSDVFFTELVTSGREANTDPNVGFSRGFAAIDSLFPESRSASSPYSGDVTLNLSRIYTISGGSISLLVPGGEVDVGLAVLPPQLTQLGLTRGASDLGIVAVQSGDVDIFSRDSVFVNSSRVFTLGGGNIAVWSSQGDIDAGRGAKTAISAPPPTAVVSSTGQVVLDFSKSVAGSGIQTISTGVGGTGGNVDLDAPAGFVNAGDAGISAAGNANIAAQKVLGVDNIQVAGTATGVPPETSGISASLSAASSVASATSVASNASVEPSAAAEQAAPVAQSALSWLDVFVEGFGEEVCKPNDTGCLQRQQRPH
ncbi:MAG TPA: filamentous hemagglutinin family protein [Steroidobacteraceae bacterium]|nr:filamentous hemagglutinin family protein [Steroidobacteraceae bacterium]